MAGYRIMGEGIRGVPIVVMPVHIVEETAHMLAQGVIEDQERVRFRAADRLRLLEEIGDPTVIDLLLEPGCLREEAGQMGFVRALQHTAGDIGQALVVQDDQACQARLKWAKLAPILQEIAKDIRMGGHDGSGRDDGKRHKTFALSPREWNRN